jgi:hypothetical protein
MVASREVAPVLWRTVGPKKASRPIAGPGELSKVVVTRREDVSTLLG